MKKFYILLLILFLGLTVLSKTADSKNFSMSQDNIFMVTLYNKFKKIPIVINIQIVF